MSQYTMKALMQLGSTCGVERPPLLPVDLTYGGKCTDCHPIVQIMDPSSLTA